MRRSDRKLVALALATLAGCSFTPPDLTPTGDASPDGTPPIAPDVRFVSVEANVTELQPGRYGFAVTATLHNASALELTELRVSLTFSAGDANRAGDLRWREPDARDGAGAAAELQPTTLAPGADAEFRFVVDALASLPAGALEINGYAELVADGATRSATPRDVPLVVPVVLPRPPIVVTVATDEANADTAISLREAMLIAAAAPGLDRIVFDPAAFPPAAPAVITLETELPSPNGNLVIDGSGAGVVLAAPAAWLGTRRWGLRPSADTLVVHGLEFRNFAHAYPLEDLTANNCGTNGRHDGGAIRVDGNATLILDSNLFRDPDVAERNCNGSSVRLESGERHRIVNNRWSQPVMDAIYVDAWVLEISGNEFNASADPAKSDDAIFINSLDNHDTWIIGNLFLDQEFASIFTRGGPNGLLYVANNTFARSRGAAIRREGDQRRIFLHNNAYHSNDPAALQPDGNGANLTISHESHFGNPMFCTTCSLATIDPGSLTADELRFTNATGSTRADFVPQADSPLVDSGRDLLDRNGTAPRRFSGGLPDRGAVERP